LVLLVLSRLLFKAHNRQAAINRVKELFLVI